MSGEADENGLIREPIAAVPPYFGPPVEQDLRENGFTGTVRRLHLNECPYPPSPKVVEAIRDAAASINRYPDSRWRALTGPLSQRLGVPQGRIFFGNGSDQIIQSLCELVLSPERAVVIPDPSFGRYTVAAKLQGARLVYVPLKPDGGNDVASMLAALAADVRLVFACTPNNPTGAMIGEAEIARLADDVPARALLVLDEAYFEFARLAGGPDGLEILKRRRQGPWVVLRTFSKAYGLAGLRCGYAVCGSDALAEALNKTRQAFHVNALAQAAATAALADEAYAEAMRRKVVAERERLAAGLSGLGLAVMPSQANYVCARLDRPAAPVVEALMARGIMIGGIRTPTPGYGNVIRITVGLPEDTDAVLAALAEALGPAASAAD